VTIKQVQDWREGIKSLGFLFGWSMFLVVQVVPFNNACEGMAATNYFDELFLRLNGDGVPLAVAVERVATAYLDGKPLFFKAAPYHHVEFIYVKILGHVVVGAH
jgi:hypothetical protein